MFDGIDLTTLITPDAEEALRLYRDFLGFRHEQGEIPDTEAFRWLWHLPPEGPLRAHLLSRPGSAGGRLRLVEAPEQPRIQRRRSIAETGPHAFDFYVRGFSDMHARLGSAGYRFRSEPQNYQLFGTSFAVDECLLEAPQGLVHALVGYLPERHRCVLSQHPDEPVSEVVAMVHVTDDLTAASRFATEVLEAEMYLRETFRGPEIERLMALPDGTEFTMALFRGPRRRNARLEFIERTGAADPDAGPAPHVVLGCAVTDLDALRRRLSGQDWGEVRGPITYSGGASVFSLLTPWGGLFEFWQRTG
ncbi:MAG: VOC family protein [Nocardiopsaceae bacterium]|nr:VOC family protein [Nocardiopsaceae bacterium]